MTDYARRNAESRKANIRRARKRRWEDRLDKLLIGLIALGALIGLVLLLAGLGAIGVYIGWNLGVYNLAHAVNTSVHHIDYWTALGASLTVGVLRRLLSSDSHITLKKTS